jgi:flagellar biosynthesis chaperone FliJ
MSDVVDKIKRCEIGMGVRKIEDYGTMFTVAEQIEVRDYIESLEKQLASQISNNTKETHLRVKELETALFKSTVCINVLLGMIDRKETEFKSFDIKENTIKIVNQNYEIINK